MSDRRRSQLFFREESMTKQSFKDECDINTIMSRFKRSTGQDYLKTMAGYAGGTYGDFSQVTDYRSALDQISKAKDMFMALPSKVRARFENDPAFFLDFCQDPANINELVELGLATKREPIVDAPIKTEVNEASN